MKKITEAFLRDISHSRTYGLLPEQVELLGGTWPCYFNSLLSGPPRYLDEVQVDELYAMKHKSRKPGYKLYWGE